MCDSAAAISLWTYVFLRLPCSFLASFGEERGGCLFFRWEMAMNVATAVSFYVDKIVADPKISGLRSFYRSLRYPLFGWELFGFVF